MLKRGMPLGWTERKRLLTFLKMRRWLSWFLSACLLLAGLLGESRAWAALRLSARESDSTRSIRLECTRTQQYTGDQTPRVRTLRK